ncbi:hypothetical protein Tco_0355942 [Tanacetum coccineum]
MVVVCWRWYLGLVSSLSLRQQSILMLPLGFTLADMTRCKFVSCIVCFGAGTLCIGIFAQSEAAADTNVAFSFYICRHELFGYNDVQVIVLHHFHELQYNVSFSPSVNGVSRSFAFAIFDYEPLHSAMSMCKEPENSLFLTTYVLSNKEDTAYLLGSVPEPFSLSVDLNIKSISVSQAEVFQFELLKFLQRQLFRSLEDWEVSSLHCMQRIPRLSTSGIKAFDDQMNSVINCLTAKSTWDDPILYHDGPSDVKESRVMDLKLCYNTFKFKEDFQDSPDDEKDSRSIQEYMNDLEEEYQARALLARSKRLFKKGTQSSSSGENKCLIVESYDWDEEEVSSDDNDVTEVKALMALAEGERTKKQSHVKHRNLVQELNTCEEQLLVLKQAKLDLLTMQHVNTEILKENQNLRNELKELTSITEMAKHSNKFIHHHFPPLEKLTGVEPVSRPKTIKSILKSKSTFKAETLKGITINEPSSAPAIGNNGSSASKTTSAPTGKLKNVKMEDDPPLAIVMKELNELKLQISKNKSSYFRTRTLNRTCDHTEFMSSMNINQYHTNQGESSSRSRPARPALPFPSCIHCGYNDHKSDDCVYYPICEICGSYDHDTHGHKRIISLRRGIKPRNPQHVTKNCETCGSNVHTTFNHNDIEWFRKREALQAKKVESFKASKTESSSALRSKTPTKRSTSRKIKQSERGISINKEIYVNDLLRMYDKIGSSVNTPIMPPNMLGPDLNGKAINEPQYKGFDLKGHSDFDYVECNMDIKSTSAMSSAEAENVVAARCCANILWMKSQLTNFDIIYEKVPIFRDNTSAIAISNNPIQHSNTKLIDIRSRIIFKKGH